METKIEGPSASSEENSPRARVRALDAGSWILHHASGTLRKFYDLKASYRDHYLEERVAYEWGWGFQIVKKTHINVGEIISISDCRPMTEAGWHMERYIKLNPFPHSDILHPKNIIVDDEDGYQKQGVGLVLETTSAEWLPKGHAVFAIIAEYDPHRKEYKKAENPF